MEVGLILLSGGNKSRMAINKAIPSDEEKTNINRVLDLLGDAWLERFLVTNEEEKYESFKEKVRLVRDVYPGCGPLSGIHSGLLASTCEYNIVVACDMPFVSIDLVRLLVENKGNYQAVVPRFNGMRQPLFALYHRSMIETIEQFLLSGDHRVNNLWEKVDMLWLEEKDLISVPKLERVFYNKNMRVDNEQVQAWISKEEIYRKNA